MGDVGAAEEHECECVLEGNDLNDVMAEPYGTARQTDARPIAVPVPFASHSSPLYLGHRPSTTVPHGRGTHIPLSLHVDVAHVHVVVVVLE